MRFTIGLSLFLFFSIDLSAQNFSGNWGFKIDGKEITLYGDEIQNQNNGGRTGTLKVAIYATNYPYSGGYLNGYNLYEYQLDPLDAGYYYTDISKTGWCTYPPKGSYSLTILLLEYISYDYEIVDYVTMSGYTRF
tara:strand:+ start:359 stop:763 length:405 start_codon:yes stop_codon:yes gene_type:complete